MDHGSAPKRQRVPDVRAFWETALRRRQLVCADLSWAVSAEKAARDVHIREQKRRQDEDAAAEHARLHGSHTLQSGWTPVCVNFDEWCRYGSWAQCCHCRVLFPLKLNQRSLDQPGLAPVDTPCGECTKAGCYVTPTVDELPAALRGLLLRDVRVLRPMTLHQGDLRKAPHGYRRHVQLSKLRWKEVPVASEIAALADEAQRARCQRAYQYLMASTASAYSTFVRQHEDTRAAQILAGTWTCEQRWRPAKVLMERYLENALWPHLYPFRDWCDSAVAVEVTAARVHEAASSDEEDDDGPTREKRSPKASYLRKVRCEILDYAADYELMFFQFDMHIFRDLVGTCAAARKHGARHQNTAALRSWSREYMRWQHRYTMDIAARLGEPDLFNTVSVNEWEFPLHAHIVDAMQRLGRQPTELPAFEALHHAHVLTQVFLGLLSGCTGDKPTKWREHLCASSGHDGGSVLAQVMHIEFQEGARRKLMYRGRGTPHAHGLTWLVNAKASQLHLKAEAAWPRDDACLAALVDRLQCSEDAASAGKACEINEAPSNFCWRDVFSGGAAGRWVLRLHHSAKAAAAGVRPFFRTLLRVLRSHTDLQTHQGSSLLLKYTMKYTFKAQSQDVIYLTEHELGPEVTARRVLETWQPMEPQMWLILAHVRICRYSWRTKRCVPPVPLQTNEHREYGMYLAFAKVDGNPRLSFLDFLRRYKTSGQSATLYKLQTPVAVGVKYVRFTSDAFFGQWLAMNVPHRCADDLLTPRRLYVPEPLLYFASALHHAPQVWGQPATRRRVLESPGHTRDFVDALEAKLAADQYAIERCLERGLPVSREAARAIGGTLQGTQALAYHAVASFDSDHEEAAPVQGPTAGEDVFQQSRDVLNEALEAFERATRRNKTKAYAASMAAWERFDAAFEKLDAESQGHHAAARKSFKKLLKQHHASL